MNNYQPLGSLKRVKPLKPLKVSGQESVKIHSEILSKPRRPLSANQKKYFQECVNLYQERENNKKPVYNI